MADQKLTALDAATTLGDADLVYVVDDVAGTPTSKKLTGANLKAALNDGGGFDGFSGGVPFRSTDSFWHSPANAVFTNMTTSTPANLNFLYFNLYYAPVPCKLLAVGVNVTTAGAATNSYRIVVLDDAGGEPGTVLDQQVIDTTSAGLKTLVLDPAPTVEGWFYVGGGSQGSGDRPQMRRLAEPGRRWIARSAGATFEEASVNPLHWRAQASGAVDGSTPWALANNAWTEFLEVRLEVIV